MRKCPSNRQAFTLIELLVVIAIIAALISILLPSLGRARELSRQTVCSANMSAMCKALYQYGNEGKGGFLPVTMDPISPSLTSNSTNIIWDGTLAIPKYINLGNLFTVYTKGSIKVYYCPSSYNTTSFAVDDATTGGIDKSTGASRMGVNAKQVKMNYYQRGSFQYAPLVISESGGKAILADYFDSATPIRNHLDSIRAAYLDGHVDSIKTPQSPSPWDVTQYNSNGVKGGDSVLNLRDGPWAQIDRRKLQ